MTPEREPVDAGDVRPSWSGTQTRQTQNRATPSDSVCPSAKPSGWPVGSIKLLT